jgi:hypothetical protein
VERIVRSVAGIIIGTFRSTGGCHSPGSYRTLSSIAYKEKRLGRSGVRKKKEGRDIHLKFRDRKSVNVFRAGKEVQN